MSHLKYLKYFGPGNGSPSATNVVAAVVVVVVVVVLFLGVNYQIFKVLRLCRFSNDRYETFHTFQR